MYLIREWLKNIPSSLWRTPVFYLCLFIKYLYLQIFVEGGVLFYVKIILTKKSPVRIAFEKCNFHKIPFLVHICLGFVALESIQKILRYSRLIHHTPHHQTDRHVFKYYFTSNVFSKRIMFVSIRFYTVYWYYQSNTIRIVYSGQKILYWLISVCDVFMDNTVQCRPTAWQGAPLGFLVFVHDR